MRTLSPLTPAGLGRCRSRKWSVVVDELADVGFWATLLCRRVKHRPWIVLYGRSPVLRARRIRPDGRDRLPMLLIGAIAGLVGEALNRKRLLLTQLFGRL
jgi:hypothetical protein